MVKLVRDALRSLHEGALYLSWPERGRGIDKSESETHAHSAHQHTAVGSLCQPEMVCCGIGLCGRTNTPTKLSKLTNPNNSKNSGGRDVHHVHAFSSTAAYILKIPH